MEILVIIQDNGKGFDHELAIVKSKSLGLRTMFERISAIGGKLKIEKGETNGTKIAIRIPISISITKKDKDQRLQKQIIAPH